MFFGFDFLVLVVDKGLGVDKLLLHALVVLLENLEAVVVLFDFQADLVVEPFLLLDLRS